MKKFVTGFMITLTVLLSIQLSAQHFQPVWTGNPYQPMSIIIQNAILDNDSLQAGDEIGVFDTNLNGNEFCVGAAIVQTTIDTLHPLVITVSADDPDTPEIDGFITAHEIIFRFYDSLCSLETINVIAAFDSSFQTTFQALGTSIVSLNGYKIHTNLSCDTICPGQYFLNIHTSQFYKINEFNYKIIFDTSIFVFQNTQNPHPLLSLGTLNILNYDNIINLHWNSDTLITISDSSLLNINFTTSNPDTNTFTNFTWYMQDSSCWHSTVQSLKLNSEFTDGFCLVLAPPGPAGFISGPDSVCQGASNIIYTIPPITNATEYIWELIPDSAGSLSCFDTTVQINFSQSCKDTVILSVFGSNNCGQGYSSSKIIYIMLKPEKPEQPNGPDNINTYITPQSEYITNTVANASWYIWYLLPEDAGVISGTDTTAVVDWNISFEDMAYIYVEAGNENCGSVSSDTLLVNVYYAVGMGEQTTNDLNITVNPNPANGLFRITIYNCPDDIKLHVINSSGLIMKQEKFINSQLSNFTKNIDIKSFPKGIYYFKFFNKNRLYLKKLIIM